MTIFPSFFVNKTGAYEIEQSLRFDGSGTYLQRTPSSSGNRQTFTISFWIKRAQLGSHQQHVLVGNGNNGLLVAFTSTDELYFYDFGIVSGGFQIWSQKKFRDPSAWYHIVFAADTTQATASDRVKVWVNGVQEDLSTYNVGSGAQRYPGQNGTFDWNHTNSHEVGDTNTNSFEGYLAEIHNVDGSQLDHEDFGEYDNNGVWRPKSYTGSYGTNGFYLKLDPSATNGLGHDDSGNGNNFTANGFNTLEGTGQYSQHGDNSTTNPSYTWQKAFNGVTNNLVDGAQPPDTNGASTTWDTDSTIPFTKLEVLVGAQSNSNGYLTVNGTTIATGTFTKDNVVRAYDITSSVTSPLDTITVHKAFSVSNNNGLWLNGVRINDELLVDYSAAQESDVKSDTPTTNYCTLNPLFNNGTEGPGTLSEGNLRHTSDNNYAMCPGTMSLRNGKYYWEGKVISLGTSIIGIIRGTNPGENTYVGYDPNNNVFGYSYQNNGYVYGASGTGTASAAQLNTSNPTFTTGDVIGVAVDIPNGTLKWYKNGSLTSYSVTGINDDDWLPAVSSYTSDTWEVNFGQNEFAYSPPTGYVALNTSNLPAPDIADGSKYFDALTYTGPISSTAAAGTTGAVTGLASGFTPDLVWIKSRSHGQVHNLFDVVRGVNSDGSGQLLTNSNTSEYTTNYNGGLASFDDGGFTVKAGIDTGGRSNNTGSSDRTYVAWCWDAGGSVSADNNTDGSITSTVSANTTAGFSIVTYTGTGTAGTVGHGLGKTPSFYVVKPRSYSNNWPCWHKDLTSDGYYIHLNFALKQDLATAVWNGTGPSDTVFNIGTNTNVNQLNATFVAYVFAEIEGYSKISYYAGNGSTNGPFVYCGFRPAFVLIKNYRGGSETNWIMRDSARSPYNKVHPSIYANTAGSEINNFDMDFLSNGFKIKDDNAVFNESGSDHLFLAFAENPFGGDGVSPAAAR